MLSWLDVKPKPAYKAKIHQGKGADHEQFNTSRAARQYVGVCQNPLQNLRGWLGADRPRGGGSHRLPSRSRTRESGANGLQSVRVAGGGTLKGYQVASRATTKRANLTRLFRKAATVKTHRRLDTGARSGNSAEPLTVTPEIDQGFINAAYEAELNRFSGLIEAAEADPTKTPAERAAAVKSLRLQQQASAAAARRAALDAEKARVKAVRKREKGSKEKGRGKSGGSQPRPS